MTKYVIDLATGQTTSEPLSQADLDQQAADQANALPLAKEEKKQQALKKYIAKFHIPYQWIDGNNYQIDEPARNFIVATAVSINSGEGFPQLAASKAAELGFTAGHGAIRDADNVWRDFTTTGFKAFARDVLDHCSQLRGALITHKDAINALGDVASVEAYDLEAGWPA